MTENTPGKQNKIWKWLKKEFGPLTPYFLFYSGLYAFYSIYNKEQRYFSLGIFVFRFFQAFMTR